MAGQIEDDEIQATYKMFRDACFQDDNMDHIDENRYQEFEKLIEEA